MAENSENRIMNKDFKLKDSYEIGDLLEIMRILRSPRGCPWDREQTHKSIRHNFLEETYEVLEAIDNSDPELLKEELGDVLLQVVFHARMEEESGGFSFSDVADGICKKLIVRHPHVFGGITVENSAEVLNNWDKIKLKTKGISSQSEAMANIPHIYPALMKSQKVQEKAKKAGFDWDSADGAFDKIIEEREELKEALLSGDEGKIQDELGDLLFAVVNVARFCRQDAETALSRATDKFISRFSKVEHLALEQRLSLKSLSLQEMDKLWEQAKKVHNK
ncbi:MAG: Nucleoside triphosphate pyrophosphohydrolase [Firmicutes bacterium ADurb.Bin300]|nr:MAG: Nucleoside triphosphate pyrophosphohydrolase [Firmicutes bacterium ADurb.Bin300]